MTACRLRDSVAAPGDVSVVELCTENRALSNFVSVLKMVCRSKDSGGKAAYIVIGNRKWVESHMSTLEAMTHKASPQTRALCECT